MGDAGSKALPSYFETGYRPTNIPVRERLLFRPLHIKRSQQITRPRARLGNLRHKTGDMPA